MASFQEPQIPHLDMITAEDPMELSSEMNPPANAEDIDIDLMANDLLQESEDDFMAEDLISVTDQELPDVEAPQAGNDDEMFDDEYPSAEFQENVSVHDEDLEDAEESTIGDGTDIIIATVGEGTATQPVQSEVEVPLQRATESPHAKQELQQSSVQSLKDNQEPALQLNSSDFQPQANADPQVTSLQGNNWPGDLEDEPLASSSGSDAAEDPYGQNSENVLGIPSTREDERATSVSLAKTQIVTTNQDESLTSKVSLLRHPPYVHPVVVVYQDTEMSLFPPIDQDQEHSQTYLLQDETHAAGSINNLLGACRSVLGESISEEDELEIQIEDLGLHLSEYASESSTTTLAQILDIYVQLHRYDGLDNPGPLYIVLCTKFRFSQRMNYLINAVAEGKGFSQLSLLEPPDEDDRQSEDVEEQAELGEDDLPSTDRSNYAEADKVRPVSTGDDEAEKEEEKEDENRRIARSTQNNLKEPAGSTGAHNADHDGGSTPLKAKVQATQFSGSIEENAEFDEGDTNEEQSLIRKVEGEVGVSSSAAVDEHALREVKEPAPEEEDFINYDEDEEVEEADGDTNREFSTRSSTVLGDSIEASKPDLATTPTLYNEQAEFIDDQLQDDDNHQGSTGQDQISDDSGGVTEADEVDGREPNESLGAGNDDLLKFDQGEDLELKFDDQEEHDHAQFVTSSPGLENEPDNPDERTDGEVLPAEKQYREPSLTHKSVKAYKCGGYPEEEVQANKPPQEYHAGDTQVGLDEHERSYENAINFTVDHADSGEGTEIMETNGTLRNGHEFNPDQDQEPGQKLTEDIDEINYEDDEPLSKIPAEHILNSSPGSLKRTRSDREDDTLQENAPKYLKRIRSG